MGGWAKPQLGFGNFVFFVLFFVGLDVSKKKYQLDMLVGGWYLADPSFSPIFYIFFNLTKPLSDIYIGRQSSDSLHPMTAQR